MTDKKITKPELVCPAGDWRSLITAVDSGADSVYFGIKGLNMRAKANNFDILQLPRIMDFLHQKNKKGYLTLNVMILNHQLEKMEKILAKAKEAGVDAVVLWDMAVLTKARELGLNVHISTQASVSNTRAVEFYAGLGARRIVPARESTLNDIKKITRAIKEKQIPCQIETFIHGAMCVSVSGRCFLSAYTWGKSANQGECKQPCRREFTIKDTKNQSEYILGKDYILSPKDLCTIEFIDQLIEAGIHAFKIEGRMRSVEYIKIVASVYRRAIDAYFQGTLTDSLKKELKEQLGTVYNRRFSTGFYFGTPSEWTTKNYEKSYEKLFLGEVTNFYKKIGVAEILIRNEHLRKGDKLLIIGKHTPATFADADELQQYHQDVQEAKRGESVAVKLPFTARRNDQVFLWKKKKIK
jgi:putative protease